jgi:hypothetical protein
VAVGSELFEGGGGNLASFRKGNDEIQLPSEDFEVTGASLEHGSALVARAQAVAETRCAERQGYNGGTAGGVGND